MVEERGEACVSLTDTKTTWYSKWKVLSSGSGPHAVSRLIME